jgi:hypothetical protein
MPRPRYHAAVSLGLASLVVLRSRRWQDALPVLVAGVLVDVDHIFDLVVSRALGKLDYAFLPLHAWEWVFGLLMRGTRLSVALAGGLAAHLALDQFNPVIEHPLFYWICVRARYGFRVTEPLLNPERYREGSGWMTQPIHEWF